MNVVQAIFGADFSDDPVEGSDRGVQ